MKFLMNLYKRGKFRRDKNLVQLFAVTNELMVKDIAEHIKQSAEYQAFMNHFKQELILSMKRSLSDLELWKRG